MTLKWGLEDDKLLRIWWPKLGQKCVGLFPGRTIKSVGSRAYTLGLLRDGRKLRAKPRTKAAPKAAKRNLPTYTGPAVRVLFFDDEPLCITSRDARYHRNSYGFIRGGPAPSIWHLAGAAS